MDLKSFIIGIVLTVVGGLIFRREFKKRVKPQGKYEMMLTVYSRLLGGDNYSFALILFSVGLMFILYSFNII